jgi:histidine ammonia-lyase
MGSQKDEPHHNAPLIIDGNTLSVEDLVAVARSGWSVQLSETAKERVRQSRAWVDRVIEEGELCVYGLTTGYGALAEVSIAPDAAHALSRNMIMSHAVGVGEPFPEEVVRATMLVRANTLAKGYSGIRLLVLETLLQMLNQGVAPLIPEKGSLGASGDLAPLAHLALVLSKGTDGGQARYRGELMTAEEAMAQARIQQVELLAKEGLALVNGSTASAALAALSLHDAEALVKNAEIALAMSLEALRGVSDAFHESVHAARGLDGQQRSAANVRCLIEGSQLIDSTNRVQDAYSLRCAPQVIGAARDALAFARYIVGKEINAATDNPLIFLELPKSRENKALSCGNFHGEPLALAMDMLGIAVAEIGNISERRSFRLLDRTLNVGLPSMLVTDSGLNSGLMMTQYTAAALVSDNKTLAHPDSVDSIPTSANQEDHVSMSMNAARHAREIAKNVEQIVGIEMLCAAQALDFRYEGLTFSSTTRQADQATGAQEMTVEYSLQEGKPGSKSQAGKGTDAAFKTIRKRIGHLTDDRPLHSDLVAIADMVHSGEIVRAVEEALGERLLGPAELTVKPS